MTEQKKNKYSDQVVIHNLTMLVEHAVHSDWLHWLATDYIPSVMITEQFMEHHLFHLLDQDETEGITYVLQFFAHSEIHYQNYLSQSALMHRNELAAKWNGRVLIFETAMEVIH